MAKVSPDEYAEKWSRRIKAATPDIQKGIQRVTESPTEKAARQADLALAKIMAAFQDGTWAAQLRKVTVDSWKQSAINKGLTRLAAGVDAATPQQREMASSLLAAVDASVAAANRTPRGDLEANVTRMTTYVREMASRKLRRPGGR